MRQAGTCPERPLSFLSTPGAKEVGIELNSLFEQAHIVVAAGTAYGEYGEGFVRFSLTVADDRLREAMERLRKALR